MLPSSECAGGIPETVCCSSIYDIANHLMSKIYASLIKCTQSCSCCGTLQAYVTMGNGDDGITDALTVAFDSAAPSAGTFSGKGGAQMPTGVHRAVFVVRLRESGWPTVEVEGETIIFPDPVKQNAIARHAYAHGEQMYRAIGALYRRGEIAPGLPQPGNVQIGALRPLTPQGGVVGFVTNVTMDLPWGISVG